MSVTRTALAWHGATGEANLSGREYEAKYHVWVSSALDNVKTIVDYFENTAGLPFLGDEYDYGNDRDPESKCYSISPERSATTPFQWLVSVKFRSAGSEEKKTGNGVDSDGNVRESEEPEEWNDGEFRVSFTQIMIPVEEAIYRGGFGAATNAVYPVGSEGPVMNSAFVPFVPPIEEEHSIRIIRREWWTQAFDGVDISGYIGAVNLNGFVVARPDVKFFDSFPQYTAKIHAWEASLSLVNGRVRWRNVAEFWINNLGWRRRILDRGMCARAMAGDPDGKGGSISAGDIEDGMPLVRELVDIDGNPVSEPVLFDGNGQPLNMDVGTPVYITYSTRPEILFTAAMFGMR